MWTATTSPERQVSGSPLTGDAQADVTIIGAGYTGLWTAYYLAVADPTLRIRVVEAGQPGAGASGRNGGWLSGLLPVELDKLVRRHGRYGATAWQRAMNTNVGDVLAVLAAEGIDAGAAHGGTITMARNDAQGLRLRAHLADARRLDIGEADLRRLEPDERRAMCQAEGVQDALWTPHCAAIHPLRLVHGLAETVVRRGVALHTETTVVDAAPEQVVTDRGTIRTEIVVLATEAHTASLPGRRRDILPVYSLMIGTDPLSDEQWAAIGLASRPTFTDARHTVIYGQRTADGRLAFGGRGAPYHFRSRLDERFDTDDGVRRQLVSTVRTMFPVLAGVEFPFHWGGALGVPRDWHPTVRFDRASRLAIAGGYAGDGVGAAHLAGRTLADLLTGHDTERTVLPWVHHHSPIWETEPWRWLGVNVARIAAERADRAEFARGGAPRRAAGWRRVLGSVSGR